ncbi:hypothetical protein ACFL1X_02990 [Candidatus Hydrogenedentota bacterium]
MVFVKTFKGYEDKVTQLDADVNDWLAKNNVDVIDIKTVLAHEPQGRSGMGDLLYTVVYRAEAPAGEGEKVPGIKHF